MPIAPDVQAALAEQVQEVIPLLKIVLRDGSYTIFLSDRRCVVNGDQYEARLLENPTISQSMNWANSTANDSVTFSLGNADRVMTRLANAVDLYRADASFAYLHIATGVRLDVWAGQITNYRGRQTDPVFQIFCGDPFPEMNLSYPRRKVSRSCWKVFDNSANGCPFSSSGSTSSSRSIQQSDGTFTILTFSPDAGTCDKSWDGPNGCLAHGMENFFGGIVAQPQTVRTRDNSTGFVGLFRNTLTTASLVSDSVYGVAMPEHYCDFTSAADPTYGLPIACKLVAFRDEGDFKVGLGIIGEGELTDFGVPDPVTKKNPHKLDGLDFHGWPKNLYGLRLGNLTGDLGCNGQDPVPGTINDRNSFSLSEGGAGIQRYGPERAAGTAFAEIRVQDDRGLQVTSLQNHNMQIVLRKGLKGFVWTSPTTRVTVGGITNPIWIAVNVILKAKGLQFASASAQAALFDMQSVIDAAAICDLTVPKMFGSGTEKQFEFIGTIGADGSTKPLKSVLLDILNSCLGFYCFSAGKIRFGIRENSSAVEAYSDGNMVYGSLTYEPLAPTFNEMTCTILDEDQGFASIPVDFRDETNGLRLGTGSIPQYEKSEMFLVGVTRKSRAARIGTTMVREELGGFRTETYTSARRGTLKTTLLGLNSYPGQIIRIDADDCPDYPATVPSSTDPQAAKSNMIEARVMKWTLNPDFSVDIEWRSTHNEIYDMVVGPKPVDVGAAPVADEEEFAPDDWTLRASTERDGYLKLDHIAVGTNADTVHRLNLDIYYVDEATDRYSTIVTSNYGPPQEISAGLTTFLIAGAPATEGQYMMCDSEIMKAGAYSPTIPNFGDIDATRGQLGTTAAKHKTITVTVVQVFADEPCKMRVQTNLDLRPGCALVLDDGVNPFEQQQIASYEPSTGILYTLNPISVAAVGVPGYSDPRLWVLQLRRETVNFQPRFFRSPDRAKWEHQIEMPHAGIAMIEATIENAKGKKSSVLRLFPVSPDTMEPRADGFATDWPHRIRTLDQTQFDFVAADLLSGTYTDLFTPIRTAEPQPFEFAYAEISGGDAAPLDPPPVPGRITMADLHYSGTITIGGTVDDTGYVEVRVTGANEIRVPVWVARDAAVSTTADAATSLRDWLNGDEHFAAYFAANVTGSEVRITDKTGLGGTLEVYTAGTITATATGFDPLLNVLIGRRYACCRVSGGYRSELSPLSESTGPTGGAARIEIRDLASGVELYATPDGKDSPLYLIPTTISAAGFVADTVPEASLAAQAQYPGPTQPTMAGKVTVTLKRDGVQWATLVVPPDQTRSNVAHGFALDPLPEHIDVNADVENERGTVNVRLLLQ